MATKDIKDITSKLHKDRQDLSADEIREIASNSDVTAEQLSLLASQTRHLSGEREQDTKELADLLDRIDEQIKDIEGRFGRPKDGEEGSGQD